MVSVWLSAQEVRELIDFAQRPNGSCQVSERLTVDAVQGGGLLVKAISCADLREMKGEFG